MQLNEFLNTVIKECGLQCSTEEFCTAIKEYWNHDQKHGDSQEEAEESVKLSELAQIIRSDMFRKSYPTNRMGYAIRRKSLFASEFENLFDEVDDTQSGYTWLGRLCKSQLL